MRKFGEFFSKRIHEKYPNGFTFVSVGRSPAFLAKYLEFQGEDVKYCPASNMHTFIIQDFSPDFVKAYKKYLKSIGLTKEKVQNAQKPIIITDYTYGGYSLENFQNLLALPEIGIIEDENVRFSPITYLWRFKEENCIFYHDPYYNHGKNLPHWEFDDGWYKNTFENDKTNNTTAIPYLDVRRFGQHEKKILNEYYQNGNIFEENFDTKMMNFILADDIHKNKIIAELKIKMPTEPTRKTEFWQEHKPEEFNERQIKVLNKLLDNFKGKLTQKKWIKICKCSPETAAADLNDLVNRKFLREQFDETNKIEYVLV